MANCFKPKTVANIDDFTILVRCGAVQSTIETALCRSPTLLTAVFRIIDNKTFINTKLVTEFATRVNLAATEGNLRLGLKCAAPQSDAKPVFVPPRVDA
jgi:hypothetical protein